MTGTAAAVVSDQVVVGGVDSHADTIHVAVVTDRGGHLADAEFPTRAAGYAAAIAFLQAHGTVAAVGVEGTSSYGAGFTRAARQAGLTVVEVNRPDKAERRRAGKSDPIDAYAAARAVASGRATSAPKDGAVGGIRALQTAARSAVKARTAALNQITHLLVTAPDAIRTKYPAQPGDKHIAVLARIRPVTDPENAALLTVLRTLARRVQSLSEEHTALTAELDKLVTELNPGLRAAYGVGPDTAAQLLITAGRTRNGCVRKRPSPRYAVRHPSRPRAGRPTGTGSPVAATAPPTQPCTASHSAAWPVTSTLANTSLGRRMLAARRKRSSGCSSAPSPVTSSGC